METIATYWNMLYEFMTAKPHVFLLIVFLLVVSSTALCFFYYKSKQPAHYALIPIWNMVVFLKIVGRPWWHIFFFLIPVYNIVFAIMLLVELNRSYGKTGVLRNIAAVVFNALYIMYLGFSDEQYQQPAYSKQNNE
jgi:signal peptidase I